MNKIILLVISDKINDLIIRDLAQVIKKLKRKWHKSQRAVVGAQRSNNTSFFFQY